MNSRLTAISSTLRANERSASSSGIQVWSSGSANSAAPARRWGSSPSGPNSIDAAGGGGGASRAGPTMRSASADARGGAEPLLEPLQLALGLLGQGLRRRAGQLDQRVLPLGIPGSAHQRERQRLRKAGHAPRHLRLRGRPLGHKPGGLRRALLLQQTEELAGLGDLRRGG